MDLQNRIYSREIGEGKRASCSSPLPQVFTSPRNVRSGSASSTPTHAPVTFLELLIDAEKDSGQRAVLVGILREGSTQVTQATSTS